MADWKITATTVYCEAIDDEVTLLITPDGVTGCTGQQRYEKPDKDNARVLKEKVSLAGRALVCTGTGCGIITTYSAKMVTPAE